MINIGILKNNFEKINKFLLSIGCNVDTDYKKDDVSDYFNIIFNINEGYINTAYFETIADDLIVYIPQKYFIFRYYSNKNLYPNLFIIKNGKVVPIEENKSDMIISEIILTDNTIEYLDFYIDFQQYLCKYDISDENPDIRCLRLKLKDNEFIEINNKVEIIYESGLYLFYNRKIQYSDLKVDYTFRIYTIDDFKNYSVEILEDSFVVYNLNYHMIMTMLNKCVLYKDKIKIYTNKFIK